MSFLRSSPIPGSNATLSSSSQHPLDQRPSVQPIQADVSDISRVHVVAHTELQSLPSSSQVFSGFPTADGEYHSYAGSEPVFDHFQVDSEDFRVQTVAYTRLQGLPVSSRYSRASLTIEQQRFLVQSSMQVYPLSPPILLPSPYKAMAEPGPVYFPDIARQPDPDFLSAQDSGGRHSISSSSSSSSSEVMDPHPRSSLGIIDAAIILRNKSCGVIKEPIQIIKPLRVMKALSELLNRVLNDQNKKNAFGTLNNGELVLSLDIQLDSDIYDEFSSARRSATKSNKITRDKWWNQNGTNAIQSKIKDLKDDRVERTITIPSLFKNDNVVNLYNTDKHGFVKFITDVSEKLSVKSNLNSKFLLNRYRNVIIDFPEQYSSFEAFIQDAADEVLNQRAES